MTTPINNKKRPLLLVLSWSAVLLCMGVIFVLSHQTAQESAELSRGLLLKILETLHLEMMHSTLRAAAHGIIYFLLGVLVYIAAHITRHRPRPLFSFALCVLYAFTDEIHQYFVPGRAFQFSDIFVDALGAAAGICMCIAIVRVIHLIKRRNKR